MTAAPQLDPVPHDDTCRMAHGGTYCSCYVNTDMLNSHIAATNSLASLVYAVNDLVKLLEGRHDPSRYREARL